MRMPIVCLDQNLRHYLATFLGCYCQPQYKYFVVILLGLILCQGGRTMSGILRQVDSEVTLSGVSRFMAQVPWQAEDLAYTWTSQFVQEMVGEVATEHARLRSRRKKEARQTKENRCDRLLDRG